MIISISQPYMPVNGRDKILLYFIICVYKTETVEHCLTMDFITLFDCSYLLTWEIIFSSLYFLVLSIQDKSLFFNKKPLIYNITWKSSLCSLQRNGVGRHLPVITQRNKKLLSMHFFYIRQEAWTTLISLTVRDTNIPMSHCSSCHHCPEEQGVT